MRTRLLAIAFALLSLAGTWIMGTGHGRALERADAAKTQAQAVAAAREQDAKLTETHVAAAASAAVQVQAINTHTNRVLEDIRHVPVAHAYCLPNLLHAAAAQAQPPNATQPNADAALAGRDAAAGAASPSTADAAGGTAHPPGTGSRVLLSAAAVRLWDSALAGVDQPFAGCSGADPASTACAAASDIDFTAAIGNNAENARLCAIDRLRHNELIDAVERVRAASKP